MAEGIHVLNKLENLLDTKTIGVNYWTEESSGKKFSNIEEKYVNKKMIKSLEEH